MTAEEALVRRERMLAIRSKVEALPERQRLAVIMHKYQQMDYKQIAEVSEVERVGNEIVVVPGVRDFAGTVKRIFIESIRVKRRSGWPEVTGRRERSKGSMVMKCEEIREMMPDLASGLMGLTPEIGEHLAGCGACAGQDGRSSADDGVAG